MPTAITAPYLALLNATVDDETFVTQTFRLMAADLRVLALSALADWDAAGLHAAAPILFQAVGALQRPAWGAWNGLLLALAKARRTIAREGDAATRKQLEQARVALAILTGLERKVDAALAGDCAPLIALAGHQGGLTLLQLLTLPIRLRNRAAHDGWSDPALWAQAAAALRPLVRRLGADGPVPSLTESDLRPEPFFLERDGQWLAFNGIDQDGAIYVAPNGAAEVSAADLGRVLLLFQRVLGQTAEQEENFRKWLGRLAPEEVKGVLMGDFLVGRPAGRGGFATVHRGLQLSTGRQVAIKILHDGLPEEAKRRFQQEAAFLARCDHPHVVGVIGHGEGPWSAPRAYSLDGEDWYRAFARTAPVKTWIALEWVDGHTLEEYVQGTVEPAPDLARQLDWFLAATEALVNVHANGLIHRDIKPSNLMVTEAGALKLMDFGIARTQADDRTIMTMTGHGLGTPAYMAPEQIRAEEAALEVGPAADLYGLCATFYEVFTGTRLYHHDRESAETVRTQKLAGQLPAAPRTLVPGLEWEMETILLGGLQPEPADRYRSAEALARDLLHVRNDEPIEYRRPALRRRIRLAYRRNRTLYKTAGALCALIVVLTGWYLIDITRERNRAEHHAQVATLARDQAEALINYMLFDLRDKLEPMGRLDLLDMVARKAAEYFERLPGDQYSDQSERNRAVALQNIGAVRQSQGDLLGAREAYETSLAITQRLARQNPANTDWQRDLGVSHNKIGEVRQAQGDSAGARESYETSLAIRERLARQDPVNVQWQRDLGTSDMKIGDVRWAQHDLAGAREAYAAGQSIFEGLVRQDPANIGLHRDLAVSHEKIGTIRQAQDDLAGERAAYEASLAIRERLARQNPENAQWQRDLAVSQDRIGRVRQAQGDLAGARASYEASLAITERLTRQDPANAKWQRDLSISHERVGKLHQLQGDLAGARVSYEASLAIRERLARQDPTNVQGQGGLALSLGKIGEVRLAQGDAAGAGDVFKAALVIARDLYRKHPDKTSQVLLAQSLGNLSYALLLDRQFKGAIAAAQEALALDPRLIVLYTNQAHGYLLTGQFDQAQAIYRAHANERLWTARALPGRCWPTSPNCASVASTTPT